MYSAWYISLSIPTNVTVHDVKQKRADVVEVPLFLFGAETSN
jgi:hypothetical protein